MDTFINNIKNNMNEEFWNKRKEDKGQLVIGIITTIPLKIGAWSYPSKEFEVTEVSEDGMFFKTTLFHKHGVPLIIHKNQIQSYKKLKTPYISSKPKKENMKLVKESLNEDRNIRPTSYAIENLTWDDIRPRNKSYIYLPKDFMTSAGIRFKQQFDDWYNDFISEYGTDGYLVLKPRNKRSWDSRRYDIEGNDVWDEYVKRNTKSMTAYYKDTEFNYKGD